MGLFQHREGYPSVQADAFWEALEFQEQILLLMKSALKQGLIQ
jgi:hypothetical protein